MGQVKPPVATRDAIENSGLEVIKMVKLAEYSQAGKIAENTVEKVCLLLLIASPPIMDTHPAFGCPILIYSA
ncbi:hypothetical protein DL93DRAFT_2074635 [Clavulina sp. PMI_390]|nr:hypothetical protein DL93DRAFT_2074635 [Clavulina sp. PMI_390]